MNVAVFLPNWIGDTVMATPTLRALRKRFGSNARLIGVGRPIMAELLDGTPWLDDLIPFDPRSKNPALRMKSVTRSLRAAQLDVAILLTHSFRTALLAWLSGARQRVGFSRGGRGWMLTDRLQSRRDGFHFVPTPVLDDYLRLAYAVGCLPESPQLELAISSADESAADRVWSKFNLPHGNSVVAINSSGAFGAAKLWPAEYFASLSRKIAEHLHRHVLVICGPPERELAHQITRSAAHPHVHCIADEALSIGLTKACVRRSGMLVTTDSGPRHFAAAFNVPVITLFGPTHIAWSETHYPQATHLQHAVPCGPCQQRTCPLGHHRCMRDLTVDEVFAATARPLSASITRAA